MSRALLWSRRAASSELAVWLRRAEAIPDATIRTDALDSLVRKRDNVEGASLFSILPRRRDERLLILLVAYQVMWDFLDSVSERGASAGHANGRQLHRALVEALDPDAPISDYYRYHPWKDDGGYLLTLVQTCRLMCVELPSYRQVRDSMIDGVERCSIQSLNHEPEPRRRDAALKAWAERESVGEHKLDWFESAAAAGAFMPHVLLALASEPSCGRQELAAVHSIYFPWIALAITMLDSFVDQADDTTGASHSYIAHYASETVALDRLTGIIEQCVNQAADLPKGRRHAVLIEGIVAWYLSANSVKTPAARKKARLLADAGGPLTRMLLPMVHAWRATRTERSGSHVSVGDHPRGLRLPAVIQTYLIWRAPFAYMQRCKRHYGSSFTLTMTNFPKLVFLSDPAEIRMMLTASADALYPGEGGAKIEPIVGKNSFMLLDGDEHLHGRRAVLPALQKRIIQKETAWVIDTVRRATASWPRGVSFPLHPRLRTLTLEVILRRIFAWQDPVLDDRLPLLRDTALAMLRVTESAVFPLPMLRRGPGQIAWKRFLRHRSEVDNLIYALIDERRATSGPEHDDVLTMLLTTRNADGNPPSQQQVRDNIVTMLVAGHETTASQLAWAFQLLAHNPHVQRRLIEEIDENAGETYMTATIQEVLRHRPVFLFTVPRAVKWPIDIGGRTYEPPAHLLACTYLLHHDRDLYPEPDEFLPERFLEGQPSPYTYLPWGTGRRRCPGSHLALLEMKMVLRTVLETMTVRPASRRMERPRWRSVIVTPHAGSRVVLHPRERRVFAAERARRTAVGACPMTGHTADLVEHGL
jgi:cytochrome P450